MEDTPLVSICIPTFNNIRYIDACLDSIAAQTYKNIEVIISDNCSSDGTIDILRNYCESHRWNLNLKSINIGAIPNFNELISRANGEYIAIYHSDDVYHPTIVERSVKKFQNNEGVHLVGTMAYIIDEKGAFIGEYCLPNISKIDQNDEYTFHQCISGIISSRQISSKRFSQFFVTPSVMVRKSVYDRLGCFSVAKKFNSAADYEMWLRIAHGYRIVVLKDPLMSYRVHAQQGSQVEIRENDFIPDIFYVLEKYMSLIANPILRIRCSIFMNRMIISVARKQNHTGRFDESCVTLLNINGLTFGCIKWILVALNRLKFRAFL